MKGEGPNKPERRKLAEDGDVADGRETAFFEKVIVYCIQRASE